MLSRRGNDVVRKVSLKPLRRVAAVIGVVAGAGSAFPAPVDAGIAAFAGACTMEMRLDFAPAAGLSPSPTSMSFRGSGTCVVNDLITTGSFNGTAAATPLVGWTCVAGVATGRGTFDSAHPSMAPFNVGVVFELAGPALSVVAHAIPTFSGVGELVEGSPTAAACLGGQPQSSAVYSGVFAFEDPTVS